LSSTGAVGTSLRMPTPLVVRVTKQSTGGRLAAGKRTSQPGVVPIKNPLSNISKEAGGADPCRISKRTSGKGTLAGSEAAGDGEERAESAIRTTCAEWVVPSPAPP
jgi:hypothetical protein